YAVNARQMREVIRRDIAMLLNTTCHPVVPASGSFKAAARSTLCYGMPPLTGAYAASKRWPDVEASIRRALTTFEPRLLAASLRITRLHAPAGAALYNTLRFEISGQVHMQPYPLAFTVQSTVDLETSRMTLV
ncbi:MAG: type VI secretion system baseplate subunit TssE, partial [Haliea sp.]